MSSGAEGLASRQAPYPRPGLDIERGSLSVCVTDPFGNQIRFDESTAKA